MGEHAKQALKASAAASILLVALMGYPSAGTARVFPLNMVVGESTAAPDGWFQFCADYKSECKVDPSEPKQVALSQHAWKELLRINGWVNSHIKPMSDMAHWGVIERWNYPDDGYGDCEDYALLKRRMLMRAGWPREALLMTVVRDLHGDGHAVLTVKTDKGEFILDNQRNGILLWSETGYEFLSRQSQSNPNKWVSLYEPAAKMLIARFDPAKSGEHGGNVQDHRDRENQTVVSLDDHPLKLAALSVIENSSINLQNAVIVTSSDAAQASAAVNAAVNIGSNKSSETSRPSAAQPGWGVQLIGNVSETVALASYQQLQKRYNGILGSRQPLVIKTNVGVGSYWYRVRIAAATRGAAESLCRQLRAAGGSCLVQPD